MHVAICGAGVIGSACAYELSKRGIAVTLIERWRVGGCASGKSGGFLAQDWCRGTPVDALARRSFALHANWAEELSNPYGFRTVDTVSAAMSLRRTLGPGGDDKLAPWLSDEAVHRTRIGTSATTAQLDPEAFTTTLAKAAQAQGATLVIATVAGIRRSSDGRRVTGVTLDDGREIAADATLIAMGPWSILAAAWVPLPAIHGLKGHSVVFRPKSPLPAETVFAEVEMRSGQMFGPEIVPRADGTLYICGNPGQGPMPVDPSRVVPEPGGCDTLKEIAVRLVPALADAKVLAEQACYRPITEDGIPLIGPIPGLNGAYVATGHSVWGMLNAPGTAEALADVITGAKPRHVDLAPFSSDRLEALDPALLQVRGG